MHRGVLFVGLLLSACALGGAWVKEGATEEELRRDVAACRGQATDLTARDRRIDRDIRAARAGVGGQLSTDITEFRNEVRDVTFERRFDQIVDRCMRGRGYTRGGEDA